MSGSEGKQGRWWILTIPEDSASVEQFGTMAGPEGKIVYIKGQLEEGEGGFRHWQLVAYFRRKCRLGGVKQLFGRRAHAELTRSEAAVEYVWKEDTYVEGTKFEFGESPFRRNRRTDWDAVKKAAEGRDWSSIPSDVLIRYYGNLRRIQNDSLQSYERGVRVVCYWGVSGIGKSRRARHESVGEVYNKDPDTKWWDGYKGEDTVIIDEYSGSFPITSLLRWLDRYGCSVETKGGSTPLVATHIFITCNLHPKTWYPKLPERQWAALERRMEIIEMTEAWTPPVEVSSSQEERVSEDSEATVATEVISESGTDWAPFMSEVVDE